MSSNKFVRELWGGMDGKKRRDSFRLYAGICGIDLGHQYGFQFKLVLWGTGYVALVVVWFRMLLYVEYFEVIGWNLLYREILDISMGFIFIFFSDQFMDRLCCFSSCLV